MSVAAVIVEPHLNVYFVAVYDFVALYFSLSAIAVCVSLLIMQIPGMGAPDRMCRDIRLVLPVVLGNSIIDVSLAFALELVEPVITEESPATVQNFRVVIFRRNLKSVHFTMQVFIVRVDFILEVFLDFLAAGLREHFPAVFLFTCSTLTATIPNHPLSHRHEKGPDEMLRPLWS